MQLIPFEIGHFSAYQSWFADPTLNRWLGPMDEEWLDAILQEIDGAQWALLQADQLIAVAGLKFPIPGTATYFLTDLATKPDLRGQGVGSQCWSLLLQEYPTAHRWEASVNQENVAAQGFLIKHGWQQLRAEADANGMIDFVYVSVVGITSVPFGNE